MARRKSRRTPKSKWARKVNKSKGRKKTKALLNSRQKATYFHLLSGGTVDDESE